VAWDVTSVMRDRGHAVSMLCAKPLGQEDKPDEQTAEGIRVVRYARPVTEGWSAARGRAAMRAAEDAAGRRVAATRGDLVPIDGHLDPCIARARRGRSRHPALAQA